MQRAHLSYGATCHVDMRKEHTVHDARCGEPVRLPHRGTQAGCHIVAAYLAYMCTGMLVCCSYDIVGLKSPRSFQDAKSFR